MDLDVGFVDLIVGFVGVTVGFLVDLDLSVGFGGFSIRFGFGFGKRCTRFGGVSNPSMIAIPIPTAWIRFAHALSAHAI